MNGNVIMTGRLYADGVLVSEKVITTAFLEILVDAMQAGSGQIDDFKYHQSGTGNTAATASDTDLETAVGSRATGNQTEGASAVVYRTSASISYADAIVGGIKEWGLFDAATGGNLLDRATFDAITISSLQTVLWTFDLTFTAA